MTEHGKNTPPDSFGAAAYGGDGWSPRTATHRDELGALWSDCGMENEWAPLECVLLHQPGDEIAASAEDADAVQMLGELDTGRCRAEHQAMAEIYAAEGVDVIAVEPDGMPSPNQMFCADLFAMTPEGAIVARPASIVRAGEERWVARRLADVGVPILKTLTGSATFEGADLMWIDAATAMIGRGLRTNQEAIEQIADVLAEISAETHAFDMPFGTMHFMGMLRIVDKDLAIAWPRRTPHAAVDLLRDRGFDVAFVPESDEIEHSRAFNFVTLGPRRILMVGGNVATKAFYEGLGVTCVETPMDELVKAAGAIGCLTGVVKRGAVSAGS